MTLKEFRELLKTNEEEAINLLNDVFRRGLDVNKLPQEIGFSWGAIRPEIYALGYDKPKNKLICKKDEQGEIIKMKDNSLKFTEEEILFLKEFIKIKTENIEELNI